ncbi:MAG: carboxypeptidase-like regulatory domain-containing protein [Thermoplasmatota archaeon]
MGWKAMAGIAALLVALAGCGSPGSGESAGTPEGLDAPALEATATTGVIRGVVVDDAIRPLANATVTVRGESGADRTAVTGADGFFGFEGLAPGTWFVSADKPAHEGAQASTEVVAGVSDPPVVKLLLVFLPSEAPFFTEIKVEAFVQCIVPGANLCAIINLYPCALAGYCQPIVEDTSHILLYDHLVALARTPDWLQTEVVWESTQSLSPALAIRYSAYSPADGAGLDERQDRVSGQSPLVIRMDPERLAEWKTGTEEGLSHEFFGHMEETSAVGSLGFVLNQRVTAFSHAFYGYAPSETWQFSVDGAAQPPR